MEEIVIIIII